MLTSIQQFLYSQRVMISRRHEAKGCRFKMDGFVQAICGNGSRLLHQGPVAIPLAGSIRQVERRLRGLGFD